MDRNHFSRKSDPPSAKFKKDQEIHAFDESQNSDLNFKRRGASLVRADFNRENSYCDKSNDNKKNKDKQFKYSTKRSSAFDSTKTDAPSNGSKFINFIKSSLNLSKSKSKSKLNLEEKKDYKFCSRKIFKSEENLCDISANDTNQQISSLEGTFENPIKVEDIFFDGNDDNKLIISMFNHRREIVNKTIIILDETCIVESTHPSLVSNNLNCFHIIKQKCTDSSNRYQKGSVLRYDSYLSQNSFNSNISKSYSFNSTLKNKNSSFENSNDQIIVISCSNDYEKSQWIRKLKEIITPGFEEYFRYENYLKITIQEAKNLPAKKRFMCKVLLDDIFYGKTRNQTVTDTSFWGESFELKSLHKLRSISVNIYKVVESRKNRERRDFYASFNIPIEDLFESNEVEKWYNADEIKSKHNSVLEPNNTHSLNLNPNNYKDLNEPQLRVKCRFKSLEIAPFEIYKDLLNFIYENSVDLARELEKFLKVKAKEEFVVVLINILIKSNRHKDFLAELVAFEVLRSNEESMILRGNSMATKAIDFYLKESCKNFLGNTLKEVTDQIISKDYDCEVDPIKFTNPKADSSILNNQKRLINFVEIILKNILMFSNDVPKDLSDVFIKIREKIEAESKSYKIEHVISSCFFLRLICPAIMSPFLFGLIQENNYKSISNRTLILVAKCLQSLANLSDKWQGKENYMQFLDPFLKNNVEKMFNFLRNISDPEKSIYNLIDDENEENTENIIESYEKSDLSYYLSELTAQLIDYLRDIPKLPTKLAEIHSILINQSKAVRNYDQNITIHPIQKISNEYCSSPSIIPTLKSTETRKRKSIEDSDEVHSMPIKSSQAKHILKYENYVDFKKCLNSPDIWTDKISPPKSPILLDENKIKSDWDIILKDINKNKTTSNPSLPKSQIDNSTSDISANYFGLYVNNNTNHSGSYGNKRQPNIVKRIQRTSNTNNQIANSNSNNNFIQMNLQESQLSLASSDKSNTSQSSVSLSQDSIHNSDLFLSRSHSRDSVNLIMSIEKVISKDNADLIDFTLNEIKRIKYLMDLLQNQLKLADSSYFGSAVEQYKQRTIDESYLKICYKNELKKNEMIKYLHTALRLLNNQEFEGKMLFDEILNYIISINERIQYALLTKNTFQLSTSKIPKYRSSNDKVSHETSSLFTQSLPPYNYNEKK